MVRCSPRSSNGNQQKEERHSHNRKVWSIGTTERWELLAFSYYVGPTDITPRTVEAKPKEESKTQGPKRLCFVHHQAAPSALGWASPRSLYRQDNYIARYWGQRKHSQEFVFPSFGRSSGELFGGEFLQKPFILWIESPSCSAKFLRPDDSLLLKDFSWSPSWPPMRLTSSDTPPPLFSNKRSPPPGAPSLSSAPEEKLKHPKRLPRLSSISWYIITELGSPPPPRQSILNQYWFLSVYYPQVRGLTTCKGCGTSSPYLPRESDKGNMY